MSKAGPSVGIVMPASEEQVVAAISDAHERGAHIYLTGGGTRDGFDRCLEVDQIMSSSALSGITDYEPAEMVMIAHAGTPMSEIEKALDGGRQRLIFEPMDHRKLLGSKGAPTIGGVAAANISGPRRFVAGAARDSLLGVRFVNGRGEAIKSGGRVMKNVTGLDLVKLLAGSRGTLGFLTEVTFKVVPQVETESTLVLHGLDDAQAAKAMATALATSTDVSGAAHLPATAAASVDELDGASTLFRLEGFETAVGIRFEKLKDALAAFGEMSKLDAKVSQAVWKTVRDVEPFADGTTDPVWRISMAPMSGHELVAALDETDAFYDWQGGLVWLRLKGDPQAKRIRGLVADHGGGHATLVRGRADTDPSIVRQPESEAVAALSARIRKQFDPNGIFASDGTA